MSRCNTCRGDGYIVLKAIETHASHQETKLPGRLVERIVIFRVPCDCDAGRQWYRSRLRGDDDV